MPKSEPPKFEIRNVRIEWKRQPPCLHQQIIKTEMLVFASQWGCYEIPEQRVENRASET